LLSIFARRSKEHWVQTYLDAVALGHRYLEIGTLLVVKRRIRISINISGAIVLLLLLLLWRWVCGFDVGCCP
jgi:hypothetical protein